MPLEAWLPIGFNFPDGNRSGLPIYEGEDWQIYKIKGKGKVLVAKAGLAQQWISSGLVQEELFNRFQFGEDTFYSFSSVGEHILSPVEECASPDDKSQALAFAEAFHATREIDSESSLHDAIYAERISRLLPIKSLSAAVADDVVLGSWLTGGVAVSVHSFRRLSSLMGWMEPDHIKDIIDRANIEKTEAIEAEKAETKIGDSQQLSEPFSLAGRAELEQFLNEHVVDIIKNQERYKALGIDFPSAIILHGPPGCGKTFAIERLVEYLGWPSFEIEASSVASPYIHETSKKVAEVFEQAMKNAPSVLIIDEMEAFLADRQSGTGHHRVEEVAEFLRRIPEATQDDVLVVAMTNHIDMIDPAIRRRGRFDHVVEVGMASEIEILSLLEKLVSDLPTDDTIDVAPLAKELKGRPLSDVTFVVREGARLAARSGKNVLSQESLLMALATTPARNVDDSKPKRKIGF